MNREERLAREALKAELAEQIKLAGIVNVIRSLHQERQFMMEQRKRSELALGSHLRRSEGWRKDLPEAERKAIATRVADLMSGKANDLGRYHNTILASRAGSKAFSDQEDQLTWKLEHVAQQLPVWQGWAKDVRGFGARSLGTIVGEAGDIGTYINHSRLWKRMGLAVIGGIRQGGLFKTAPAAEWIAHGYHRKRRSHMFVIGECLVKTDGEFRQVYLARKAYERARAAEQGLSVVPAAKIPQRDRENYMSDGHIHKRSQRYMEKKLLRRLWQAWQRVDVGSPLPAKSPSPAIEIRALESGPVTA